MKKVVDWRSILAAVRNRNPTADREALLALFKGALVASPEGLAGAIEFCFNDEYPKLFSPSPSEERQEKLRAARSLHRVRFARRVGEVLMDLRLPTGKRLRNSTKEEVEATGGWYAELGAKMKRGQTVGQVWKEGAVRQLFDSWAMPKAA